MDNSGRREAPITFFFFIEFCFIQHIHAARQSNLEVGKQKERIFSYTYALDVAARVE